jgi:hypothetical protein
MKKLILAMFTSVDGYIEGPNGEFVPPPWSAEVGQVWSEHNLSHAGHLIYGRVNFQYNGPDWAAICCSAHHGRAVSLLQIHYRYHHI